jgi:hypothetical protein
MLRKIKSCPANICNMAHRKKPKKSENKDENTFIIPLKTAKIIKKGDAVNEIVTSSLLDVNINDPTEQLFFLIILKKFFSKTKTDLSTTFYEICIRASISCLTHKVMHIAILNLHSHINLLD